MSQTSNGHPLDRRDPADAPPCPMERLADRFNDAPVPPWLVRYAHRGADACCYFTLEGCISEPDQLDRVIDFLSRVRG